MFRQFPINMDIFSYTTLLRGSTQGSNDDIKSWNPGHLGILEKFNISTEVTKCLDSNPDRIPFVWSGLEEDVLEMIRSDPDMEECLRSNQADSSEFKSLNDLSIITRQKEPAQGIRLRCWLYDRQLDGTTTGEENLSKVGQQIYELDMFEEKFKARLDACDILEDDVMRFTEAGMLMDGDIDTILEDMNRANENIENEIENWLEEINAVICNTGWPVSATIEDDYADENVSYIDQTDKVILLPQLADIRPSIQPMSWKTIC